MSNHSRVTGARPQPYLSSNPVIFDLTKEEPAQPKDHMHSVVQLLRPQGSNAMPSSPVSASKSSGKHRSATSSSQRNAIKASPTKGSSSKPFSTPANVARPSFRPPPAYRPSPSFDTAFEEPLEQDRGPDQPLDLSDLEDAGISTTRIKKPEKRAKVFHLFLQLPPEIRNNVYKLLLTTPGTPIELPNLTGVEGRRKAAAWAACTTAKQRRKHKRLFLEILQCSKQVHNESSGIIYGCNVFKYRCNWNSGPRGSVATLPTRHLGPRYLIPRYKFLLLSPFSILNSGMLTLPVPFACTGLLKNIKIAAMSKRHPERGHFQWVADLITCFQQPGLQLESFELSWYGFNKTILPPTPTINPLDPSPSTSEPFTLTTALLLLTPTQHFKLQILGEARMRLRMVRELERGLKGRCRRVEIQRPVRCDGVAGSEDEDEDEDEGGGGGQELGGEGNG